MGYDCAGHVSGAERRCDTRARCMEQYSREFYSSLVYTLAVSIMDFARSTRFCPEESCQSLISQRVLYMARRRAAADPV